MLWEGRGREMSDGWGELVGEVRGRRKRLGVEVRKRGARGERRMEPAVMVKLLWELEGCVH